MTGERAPLNHEHVYRTGEDFSEFGALPVEAAMQKGKQIKSALQKILGYVEISKEYPLLIINISLDEAIKLVVIPRQPIIICNSLTRKTEITREPQLIETVVARVMQSEKELSLVATGRLVDSNFQKVEFEPLAGHGILAVMDNYAPGGRSEGGIRLSTSAEGGSCVLNFELH